MALLPQLDNLKIAGLQTASIALFSNVARQMQITHGSDAAGWLTTVQSLNDVITADNMRVLKLQDSTSTQYIANSIVTHGDGKFVNQASIESITASVPTNITTANGIIAKTSEVVIHEKTFANTSIESYTANVAALNTFITTKLDSNPTYIAANVSSTLDYALQYGHLSDWTNLTSKDFDLTPHSETVGAMSDVGTSILKSVYASQYI
jgi:hypothetical protein